eukprot:gene20590-biopygen1049
MKLSAKDDRVLRATWASRCAQPAARGQNRGNGNDISRRVPRQKQHNYAHLPRAPFVTSRVNLQIQRKLW